MIVDTKVQFSKLPPPCYEECRKKFGIDFNDGIAFTYGNTIHCINSLPDDLLMHEVTHIKQQEKVGAENWWAMYLDEPSFRLTQEIEAYQVQYRFLTEVYKDRNKRAVLLHKLASLLSGSMYGNLISLSQAKDFIRNPNK